MSEKWTNTNLDHFYGKMLQAFAKIETTKNMDLGQIPILDIYCMNSSKLSLKHIVHYPSLIKYLDVYVGSVNVLVSNHPLPKLLNPLKEWWKQKTT